MQYYIMVNPDSPNKCKVGITKDLPSRLRAYRTANPQCYYYATYYDVEDCRYHEKQILDLLRDLARVDREYVHCSPHIVQNIVEGYFADFNVDVNVRI